MNYSEAKSILKQYNQEQVLNFYDNLSDVKKNELLNQIDTINFEQLNKLYYKAKNNQNVDENIKIEPIEYVDKSKMPEEEITKLFKIGAEKIRKNKLAVVTMAGGQGTRLGHLGPKGTFMLGTNPNKSLFEILCDTLKEANNKYNICIPWYIMTSRENNEETVKFFKENNYFNYDKNSIVFFKQGELPMIDMNGKILLKEDGTIKKAADGHGGIFEAMFKNNIVEDIKKRNIEWVFVGPIDNPLANMVDEVLIGLAEEKEALSAGKSIVKANSKEKVGVFCKKNGKPSVVEYTEITEDMAEERNNNGELLFGESHINCNMFNIKGIEKIGADKLPYHVAFKKAKYMNKNGEIINPTEPNSYKFESFIFDAFSKLDNMAILRVKREEEFAPVKNAEGTDSPETARKLYLEYHKN